MTAAAPAKCKKGTIEANDIIADNILLFLDDLQVPYKKYKDYLAINCPVHGGDHFRCHIYCPTITGDKCRIPGWICWSNNCHKIPTKRNSLLSLVQIIRGDTDIGDTFSYVQKFRSGVKIDPPIIYPSGSPKVEVSPTAPASAAAPAIQKAAAFQKVDRDSWFVNWSIAEPHIKTMKTLLIVQSDRDLQNMLKIRTPYVVQAKHLTYEHKRIIDGAGLFEVMYMGDERFHDNIQELLKRDYNLTRLGGDDGMQTF
jgi:hypothetical protein